MRYLVSCILIFISSHSFSQKPALDIPSVQNSTIEFNGGKYSGYMVELNAPPDIVEDAIKQKFKLQGVKPKETKGFMVFRNVVMTEIDPEKPMDAFIKAEKKSRKEKEQTIVYLIAALPGEVPEEKIKSDEAAKSTVVTPVSKGDAFLIGLVPGVNLGVYERDLTSQQMVVKKEEKKLANLKDDQADMEKKLKKLQDDLEYNKKAQERQTAEVEKAKAALNELISKPPSKGGQ